MGIRLVGALIIFTFGLFTDFGLCTDVTIMTKDELKIMLENLDFVIIDLRLTSDYSTRDLKIRGAVRPNMGAPLYDTVSRYSEGKTLVLYCASPNERRSTMSARSLMKERIDRHAKIYVLGGGWKEWLKADYPTENK